MEPNEALFDAINRGDIATARDAVSRGADLRAQNVLGMTPLELAIDLGRNDIAFMLLSQRSPDDGRTRTQPVTASKQPAPVRQAKQQPPRQRVSTPASVPAAPQTARLFSGDGGAPNPSAGFLGFDAGRR
jgi:ankyrin repeat protein